MRRASIILVLVASAAGLASSRNGVLAAEPVDYATQIKPLLTARCYACHGALKQESSLRLDLATSIRQGGDSGPAAIAGKSSESLLIERVIARDDLRMPPEAEGELLKPEEVALLRNWIDQGMTAPADEKPEADPREHWAFQSVVRPAVPVHKNGGWANNQLDAFIAAEHEQRNLSPLPAASKSLLLRRVYLDLIGLPPTRDELQAFLSDESPDAYERVVDRLLASPQHGERWGRHWMDVWRYSDWWGLGAEVRNSQKHIWHWRDWIVESANADKGYDQIVREMLAADELYPNDLDRLRGGGFLARHYFKFNRTTWLDGTVEHTAKAFLGLTLNCAKCHDHKYDPFTQEEYYQFRAIFEPYQIRTEMVPGQVDFEKDGIPRAFDCNLDAPTFLHHRGDERQPVTDKPIPPGVPAFLASEPLAIELVTLPTEAHATGLRPYVLETLLHHAQQQIAAAQSAVEKAQGQLAAAEQAGKEAAILDPLRLALTLAEKELAAAQLEPDLARARAAADRAKWLPKDGDDAPALAREAAKQESAAAVAAAEVEVAKNELDLLKAAAAKKPPIEKKLAAAKEKLAAAKKGLENPGEAYTSLSGSLKTLESNVEKEESRRKPYPSTSTGRRTALAEWITDRRNPLAARVAVNHLWSRHLGQPLVPTVFDFGRKGTPPTHPELLDWLAAELVESGWSMKHLHRLIVTSNTYRLRAAAGSSADVEKLAEQNRAADPENKYYWRRTSSRMEAQVVRDSLLAQAGDLDLTLGGPSIPVANEDSRRRSLYFVHSHNEHQKFLAIFDDANVLECYRRAESIVPQQALALSNSKLALTVAQRIAERLTPAHADDRAFAAAAWETVLCCQPTEEELTECLEALDQLKQLAAQQKSADAKQNFQQRARAALVQALINHNDYVTIR